MTRQCVLQDTYKRLTFKTVAFWEHVSMLYDVTYVVKVDDDSYVRLDRLAIALRQWVDRGAGKALPAPSPWELCSMLLVTLHDICISASAH